MIVFFFLKFLVFQNLPLHNDELGSDGFSGISLPRVMSAARVEEAYLIGVLRKRRKDNYDDGCGCL